MNFNWLNVLKSCAPESQKILIILTLFFLLSLNEKWQESLKEERHKYFDSNLVRYVLSKSKNNTLCQHLIMKYYNTKNVSIFNGAGLQSANNSITKEVFF